MSAATTRPSTPKTQPRTDIQALRAIAVSAVVAYHLWPTMLRGGFVGVDIFFVISGFLITQQLAGEFARNGRISLTRFWARRIRRLLPAALLVLGVSMAILFTAMPRVSWENNLQEIRAAAAYCENWLLGVHSVDYLAASNSPSLVQHYWSLSVEEQFYLGWPLLLLAALAARRSPSPSAARLRLMTAVAVLAIASLIASVRLTAADPSMAFFATQTRAWEFAVGGMVALLHGASRHRRASRFAPVATWLGIAAIAYSTLAITAKDPFPGVMALLPVCGAAAVLAVDTSSTGWSPMRFARTRPVQWLGDNSYSIYLWHWPLIIAAPWLLSRGLTPVAKLAILALSLVLAGVTKRFVEDPVRYGRPWRTRRWPAYGFAVVGVAAFLLTTSVTYVHLQRANRVQATRAAARADAAARTVLSAAAATPSAPAHNARGRARALLPVSCFGAGAIVNASRCPHPYARPRHLDTAFAAEDGRTYQCLQPTDASTAVLCDFGRTKSPLRTIAIVGNSHARRLVPALDLYGREVGWRIILAARINCMGLITEPIGNQDSGDSCLAWSRHVQHALLAVPHLDAVIFASFSGAKQFLLPRDASPADVRTADQRMVGTWSAFARRGIQVIVTEDVPGMRPHPDPDCLAGSSVAYDPCAVDRATVVHSNIMTRLARQNPRLVTYVRLTQYFCDARKCHALIGGVVVYFDTDHLTLTYSRSLAPYLGAELNAALRR